MCSITRKLLKYDNVQWICLERLGIQWRRRHRSFKHTLCTAIAAHIQAQLQQPFATNRRSFRLETYSPDTYSSTTTFFSMRWNFFHYKKTASRDFQLNLLTARREAESKAEEEKRNLGIRIHEETRIRIHQHKGSHWLHWKKDDENITV